MRCRAVLCLLLAVPAQAVEQPRDVKIVNGSFEHGLPEVAWLWANEGFCSATLVGCRTLLTAAHCFCVDDQGRPLRTAACQSAGKLNPARSVVVFPHAGSYPIASIAVHPQWGGLGGHDLAVVRLSENVTGIRPAVVNQIASVPHGTEGVIAGFGRMGGPSLEIGIKRAGPVTTAACRVPTHVCWNFDGEQSSTCNGDSGGPLFVSLNEQRVLAGVTSFGSNRDCLPPARIHDADVFLDRAWIASQAGADLAAGAVQCSLLPSLGAAGTTVLGATNAVASRIDYPAIDVPAGTTSFRIGTTATGASTTLVNGPAGQVQCQDIGTRFDFCELTNPAPGSYSVAVRNSATGPNLAQTIWTVFSGTATPSSCVPAATALCLNQGRFKVEATFNAPGQPPNNVARVVPLTDETGFLYFFSPSNVEVVVKVLNACGLNQRFWVFAGGLTDVNVILTVTDTRTGAVKTYSSPQGRPFQPIQDSGAFPSCP